MRCMAAEEIEVLITPLGAAIVEAMPDRKQMRRIQTRFKKHQECPASAIFSDKEVQAFYRERGQIVEAVNAAPNA